MIVLVVVPGPETSKSFEAGRELRIQVRHRIGERVTALNDLGQGIDICLNRSEDLAWQQHEIPYLVLQHLNLLV